MTTVMQGPWLNYFCCPPVQPPTPCCPPLTVTHTQDLNRVTYNATTGVLNLPPPIAARRIGLGLTVHVPADTWVQIPGLSVLDLDTTAVIGQPMVPATPDDRIVIVKTGRYNLTVVAGTDQLTEGNALIVRALINGVQAGAASAPYVGNGVHVTPIQVISLHALQAGDVIQLMVRTDQAAGLECTGAHIAVEYVEGT